MRLGTHALLLIALMGGAVVSAVPASASTSSGPEAAADAVSSEVNVDDFDYASWHSHYEIGLDDEGRATAHVYETLVAEFPEFDQNKGIVRGLPERYEGAGLSLEILSVTDEDGEPVPYEVDTGENGATYVLTGTDEYVHGRTTYVIEYTMRDVMIAAAGSGLDEFYWDLLPLDSTQDIRAFSAEVAFSPALADAYAGEVSCYQGPAGSTTGCSMDEPMTDDGSLLFSLRSGQRTAGDGVTVAIGFDAATVTQPAARHPDPVADFGAASAAGAALLLGIGSWLAWARFVQRRRTAGGFVVAQYDVPRDLPPLLAAAVLPKPEHVIPAEIVHLGVNGALRIEETADGKDQHPLLRLTNREAATSDLDQNALNALFPDGAETRDLTGKSKRFGKAMRKLVARGPQEAARRGWTEKARSRGAVVFCLAAVGVLAIAIILMIWSIIQNRQSLVLSIVTVALAGVAVAIVSVIAASRPTVLTAAGAERYAYLMGVREFIRVAEADRIRMLQSYAGAERRADGAVDVVVLYERLLPYAMLLGEEKTWARVLEVAYSDAGDDPGWINNHHGAAFVITMTTFSNATQTAADYRSPSSGGSSGGGGSIGGGFSGGGGGGGFSGGR